VKSLEENGAAGRALSREEEKALLELASRVGQHQGKLTSIYTVIVVELNIRVVALADVGRQSVRIPRDAT